MSSWPTSAFSSARWLRPEPPKTCTFVYLLQDDYDYALERMPGGKGAGGAQRPIILTPVDFGGGYGIRCPFCNTLVPFQED